MGEIEKILCVCSMGINRSRTCAEILSKHYTTRYVGLDNEDHDMKLIDGIEWADVIIVMDDDMAQKIKLMVKRYRAKNNQPIIIVLNIPDRYEYRNIELIAEIMKKLKTTDLLLTPAD